MLDKLTKQLTEKIYNEYQKKENKEKIEQFMKTVIYKIASFLMPYLGLCFLLYFILLILIIYVIFQLKNISKVIYINNVS